MLKIGRVPIEVFYQDDGKKKPVVCFLHGTYTSVDTPMNRHVCEYLAEQGFYVIMPEPYAHGSRDQEEPVYKCQEMLEMIKDVNAVLDEMTKESNTNADFEKLGLIGFSLGGMFVHHYTAFGKYHPKAIATCAGVCDIVRHYDPDNLRGGRSRAYDPAGTPVYSVKTGVTTLPLTKEYCLRMNRETSAWLHREKYLDAAVLLMYGEEDTTGAYPEDNGGLFEYLSNHPDSVYAELFIQPGLTHDISEEELLKAAEHFKRWLK